MPTSTRTTLGWIVALAACVLAIASTSTAADLFHSPGDDGTTPGGVPTLATAGPESLNLYVDNAGAWVTTTGTACVDGDGGEICAVQFVVRAETGVAFDAFLPEAGVDFILSATELRANRIDGLAPGIEPMRLGALIVHSTDPATGGEVLLESAALVTARFELEGIPSTTLAIVPVPEPGLAAALSIGILLLLVIVCRRGTVHAHGLAGARPIGFRRVAPSPALALLFSFLFTGLFSLAPPAAEARSNTCDAEYPNNCAGTLFDPCLWSGSFSRDCGGFEEPICKTGAACDSPYNPIGGICTNQCGVSESITCDNGCVSGIDEHSLDPIRAEVRAGTATQPGIDAQVEDVQTQIQAALTSVTSQVRSTVPSSVPNPIEQDIEDEIIDCITELIPSPSALDGYAATANYCFATQPVAFDARSRPTWPLAEAAPAARTVIGIHGRLGGGYLTENDIAGIAGDLEPGVEIRAYQVDYNARGEGVSQTMRVYERLIDGSWSTTPVFEGPASDGTNFTIPDVASFVRDFIAQLPDVGPIAIFGASQGGFVARDLVYRHYDGLRLSGKEIVKVVFLGHPHFGIVLKPEDYVWVICSEILTQTPEAGSMTAEATAQDCATARWMTGWNDAAAGLGPFTPYLDNRSHPQIDWISIAGDAGGPGAVIDFPFWDRFTGVPRSSVVGDGTVPTDSSLGLDTYASFHVGDLQFDRTATIAAGHSARALRDGLAAIDPDWLEHRAVCGDVDGIAGLMGNDAGVLQLGLLDPSTLPPDFAELCSVEGGPECDLLDAVRLERWTAGLEPRGLQSCPAAGRDAGVATFYFDRSSWLAALGTSEFDELPTSAGFVATANEVAALPADNSELCGAANPACTLHFDRDVTGLCRDFEVRAYQGITFNDIEVGSTVVFPSALSIGDIDNGENDDFEIRIPDSIPTYAAGVTLVDNAPEVGERLVVIGQNGAILGTLDDTMLPPSGTSAFVGVITSEPISSIYFDEHPGGDDIAIKDFVFERTLADTNLDDQPDCDARPLVQFTTNLTTWSNAAGTVNVLETGSGFNIALANEVGGPPAANAQLCFDGTTYQTPCSLTFPASSTGFCRDFAISVQQGITFNDNEISDVGLSIGDVDNGENDDFEIHFSGGPDLYSVGFTLANSGASLGEELRVFGTSGELLGKLTVIPANTDSFIGVRSDQPIGHIEFDEDAGGDDIVIRDPRFDCDGVP